MFIYPFNIIYGILANKNRFWGVFWVDVGKAATAESDFNGYNIRKAVLIPVNATGAIPIQDSPS